MSRAERGTRERTKDGSGADTQTPGLGSAAPWAALGFLAILAGGVWLALGTSQGSHHPDPRPEINGETVVPASRYIQYARVSAVYSQAKEIASVLDGLYCHCDCSKHSGHRSLLTCFETDHGAACDICLSEASIAYRMTKAGRSLEEIRDAIDDLYGS